MNERTPAVERRQNLELRAIFDEAYTRIEPFLDPAQTWGGAPLTVLAYHALREAYPELSSEDAHVLIVAAKRVYNARRLNGAHAKAETLAAE
jgi:hypothetical protein